MILKFSIQNISPVFNKEQIKVVLSTIGNYTVEKIIPNDHAFSYIIQVYNTESVKNLSLLNGFSIGGFSLVIEPLDSLDRLDIEKEVIEEFGKTKTDDKQKKIEYKDPILCTLLSPERARKLLHSSFHSTLWEKICFLKTFEELGIKLPEIVQKQIDLAISRTNRTIFITKIAPTINKDKFRTIVRNFGEVNDIRFNKNNKTGFLMAFVEFRTKDSAKKAIYLDGATIEGNNVSVTFSRNPIIKSDDVLEKAYLDYRTQIENS